MSAPVRLDAATVDLISHFQHRVIQDALTEATGAYWLKRAEQFAAVGNATCDQIALSCQRAASLAQWPDLGEGPL